MGDTKIQWTDKTWNPWHGCHKVSGGCKNCYMFREKKQYGQDPNIVVRSKTTFRDPLKWKEPFLVFTCSWSDWFIEEADAWRDEAWDIIHRTPHLTYQILTKRIERAAGRVPVPALPNVWLGVSAEDQKTWDERTALLEQVPAAVRFVSLEPQLDYVNVGPVLKRGKIHWLVQGGESGPGARPFDVEWARDAKEKCNEYAAYFLKQVGAHVIQDGERRIKANKKGGDMDEWPHDVRVREFPFEFERRS